MNSKNNDNEIHKLKHQLHRNIEVMKVLNSHIRFRIVLLLLIYRKLSLSELSKLLERTKSTLFHHLKKLENIGILKISRKDVRGSVEANFYELVPKFFQTINIKQKELISLKDSEIKDILHLMVLRDQWIFETVRSLFEQTRLFYDGMDNFDPSLKINNTKELLDYYFENKVNYNMWLLNNNEYKKYEDLIDQFDINFRALIEPKNRKKKDLDKSYLILHTILPLKEIAKYESERKKYRKFFKVLE